MGERRGWYILASHLGQTLQEVQRKTTSSEFEEWKIVLEEEINDQNILYHYLARIAYEVARSNPNIKTSSLKKLKIADFKIKVGKEIPKKAKVKSTPKTSKKVWLSSFGIKQPAKKIAKKKSKKT